MPAARNSGRGGYALGKRKAAIDMAAQHVQPQLYCAWCGAIIRRQPTDDGHGLKYHVVCLAERRAVDRHHDAQCTRFVIETLTTGAACFACIVRTNGLPEAEIVSALRRLNADVSITVGPCSRCGVEIRLLCRLATDSN